MTNPFQDTYENRLRSWSQLRKHVKPLPLEQACIAIDEWWQQAPLITNHFHPNDSENWTDPWTLLLENQYCLLTRAIGICYTLIMIGDIDLQLVEANDTQCESHYLVLVNGAKYTLNYWPDSVISTPLSEFSIIKTLPIVSIRNKIK